MFQKYKLTTRIDLVDRKIDRCIDERTLVYGSFASIPKLTTFFRNLTFYGEQVKSFILRAGEVIYMPHFVEHIVYNPEFTVAIGENLLFSTAMEEVFVSMPYNLRKSFVQR
jgi:hypothetical protein